MSRVLWVWVVRHVGIRVRESLTALAAASPVSRMLPCAALGLGGGDLSTFWCARESHTTLAMTLAGGHRHRAIVHALYLARHSALAAGGTL